jgi:2-polyprenyl-6-methoxyphenol hydroxylase-like FAD-dependent oxidoreductase
LEKRSGLEKTSDEENQGSDIEAFFDSVLASCPAAAARLAQAERATPVRSAANYSYRSSRQTGPGFALAGDAFTFIDPVFSSGVYIAMSSADALIPSIEHWLEGRRLRYRMSALAYRRRVARGIRAFKWFIYRFNTPAMVWLFENPRNVLNVERAVVSMLAGDVYDRPGIRARLLVFKLLYATLTLVRRLAPGRLTDRPKPSDARRAPDAA